MRIKYLVLGIVAFVAVAIGAYFFFGKSQSAYEKFAAEGSGAAQVSGANLSNKNTSADKSQEVAKLCPKPQDLVKKDLKWSTSDGRWENYTPSSAKKIMNFLGAQWVGVKVGKVICLYQADEAVSFPVALEQTRGQLILEPQGYGWSSLVNNRRFCKSASIVDCPYFVQEAKDIGDVYKEIRYAPKAN